jgi:hypothetical protein
MIPLTGLHSYDYIVRGQGLPVHFMIQEESARGDDYGILHIRIASASEASAIRTASRSPGAGSNGPR